MADANVAIIGSGIAGTLIAYELTQRGYTVEVFEKGPGYAYPHAQQFAEQVQYLYTRPGDDAPPDIKNLSFNRDLPFNPNSRGERLMREGGSATAWQGITPRMHPNDFRTQSLYGYGMDWPLSYDELEPYYVRAETMLGISGSADDNPFAGPRSAPYPLPPFELSYEDQIFAERLMENEGIVLHTTPQARTRLAYEDRAGCQNFGTCATCPIGARYSPQYHLQKAVATGLCNVRTNVSVRRILTDESGQRAVAVAYQDNDSNEVQEFSADVIVVAAGAFESARLLLLSATDAHPNGLGNSSGHVGRNLAFHHLWVGTLRYGAKFFPGRFGGWTGMSQQFHNAETRGQHAAVKVEFSSLRLGTSVRWQDVDDLEELFERASLYRRLMTIHAESPTDENKFVRLSSEADRFGDRFAHVQYQGNEFDAATHAFGLALFERFRSATGAEVAFTPGVDDYASGAHHMGTTRMSADVAGGVVNPFGEVHDVENLFMVGSGVFVGPSGPVNPTLTISALTLRTADYLLDQNLAEIG